MDGLLPLAEDPADPLGGTDLVTHGAPMADAPAKYETQKNQDGCIKVCPPRKRPVECIPGKAKPGRILAA
jgi:hypothetical protein